MKKLSVGFVLVAVLVMAGAVPAGAVAAKTLPLDADCGDRGDLTFHIIEGEGSLVGFEEATGRPVVLHGVDGKFIIDVFVDGEEPVGSVEQVEDFLKGKGNGLKLTHCEADDEVPIFSDTFPLNEETAGLIFAEFGIEVDPNEGDEVTVTGRFEGTLQVQFPGR